MAKTIKPGMTMKAINKIFHDGGEILIKSGKYNITAPMLLKTNSKITCEENVIFYKKCETAMIQIRCMKSIIKYKGLYDITWIGGKFVGITHMATSNMVEMCHARLITFENAEFVSCRGLHFIEINSSKDITIRNCRFLNHITQVGKEHKEAIQIDFANIDGFPYGLPTSRMYDGTHCKNILIEGCTFSDCPVCVGTHTVTTIDGKMHELITIRNNKAIGRGFGTFVRLLNMKNVEIYGNDVRKFENGIYYERMKTGHIATGGTMELPGYKFNKDVRCHDNTFTNVANWFYAR